MKSCVLYGFEHISLSLFRMRNVSGNICRENETHVSCSIIFFFRKLCPSLDKMEKYCTAAQPTFGAYALQPGYLRLQTHSQNVSNLLLFHCNNGDTKAPHIACLVLQIIHTEAQYLKEPQCKAPRCRLSQNFRRLAAV